MVLFVELCVFGVIEIEGCYDGYGDSGNFEYMGYCLVMVEIDNGMILKFENFIWVMVYV